MPFKGPIWHRINNLDCYFKPLCMCFSVSLKNLFCIIIFRFAGFIVFCLFYLKQFVFLYLFFYFFILRIFMLCLLTLVLVFLFLYYFLIRLFWFSLFLKISFLLSRFSFFLGFVFCLKFYSFFLLVVCPISSLFLWLKSTFTIIFVLHSLVFPTPILSILLLESYFWIFWKLF